MPTCSCFVSSKHQVLRQLTRNAKEVLMDPVTILGTAGAVLSIIDVLSRTLKSLRDLYNTWKDADLTIVNLMSQLIALRAALGKISEWMSLDLAHVPQHHQLVMDLEDSVTCCRMLVKTMDDQLSKLTGPARTGSTLEARSVSCSKPKPAKIFRHSLGGRLARSHCF